MTITTLGPPEIPRDRYGRPLVTLPGGGKPTPYTRCTTFVGVLEDTYNLAMWQQRMVALGLGMRPDLLLAVAAHGGEKDKLNAICEDAKEAAAAHGKATIGTALHALTEQIDRGLEIPVVPEAYVADLAAYVEATKELKATHIEQMCVQDPYRIAGTPDRVVRYQGKTYIADLKGLALTTPIPTPDGWTTMGAVDVGDMVFAADGAVCQVVAKSAVKQIGTYIVSFDDGSKVVCDTEHLWWTTTGQRQYARTTAKPITEVLHTLSRYGQHQHRVPVAGSLRLPDIELPIDPYLLGCWLGDGHVRDGCITKGDDLFDVLLSDGHALGARQVQPAGKEHIATRSVVGLNTALNRIGLRHNKHVPDVYLRAGTRQRLRLLQGLMDTDGTWNTARRRATLYSCDKGLAIAVVELLATLGQRPHIAESVAHGFGLDVALWTVEFLPVGINPFRLPRKADQAAASTKRTTESSRRVIVGVTPGPDVSTACIAVDSDTHTYLCGERMIPTHNTGAIEWGTGKIAMQLAVYARSQTYDWETNTRGVHGADTRRAIVVHLPAGEGRCVLHWVDIEAGWTAVTLARHVREWRKRKGLLSPFQEETPELPPVDIPFLIRVARTNEALVRIWSEHEHEWTEELTQLAKEQKAAIEVDERNAEERSMNGWET